MLIDIDDEALDAAQKALGAKTKKETVNRALTEAVTRINRAEAHAELARLAAEGALDLGLLQDKSAYRPTPPTGGSRQEPSAQDELA
ncbi:type II toxin-antitoxin system VapB family antitoxin [Streptacidiphilus sp. MAP5-3]